MEANVTELFGSSVFNEAVMRERLPKDVYKSLKRTIDKKEHLESSIAEVVANAMKEWALEKGATHYTHWFQPMTGITAEKHDSFISPTSDGRVIMEFSGKELIKGEPDASSFPSGGLRATFEARGYTAWDPSSYAFVKEDTLYIPTVFCSYSGEVLDKKTPLLRSMDALSEQAIRILRMFGNTTSNQVITTVGPEQEYFLVDAELYKQRKDLIFTGRTLFGAKPPKGQELEDHYFGNIKERVKSYMRELDEELWKLGISAKTEHNEVAPAQHELAPIFDTSNVASDHNQLTMELMKKVAKRHGLECLLHEKPFAGVNGSGKHNNWSISTDDGKNLLDPGKNPADNLQFMTFLAAVVKAVDDYSVLIRLSVATAGNDHRLGANEAPPAIISMFVGDQLDEAINAIKNDEKVEASKAAKLETGVEILPAFRKDTTDRNRTSPFAFTGNKFEFRMVGSALNISGVNIVLNTVVAETLRQFADELSGADDFETAVRALIKKTFKEHEKIIFNGNNYSDEWVEEAERRGLPNLKTSYEALPHFADKENVAVFVNHKVFSEAEVVSRCEILIENYIKALNIEALTMSSMARREILPAVIEFTASVCDAIAAKKAVSDTIDVSAETKLAEKLSKLTASASVKIDALDEALENVDETAEAAKQAEYYGKVVLGAMEALRADVDELETMVSAEYWPMPTYAELLFNV